LADFWVTDEPDEIPISPDISAVVVLGTELEVNNQTNLLEDQVEVTEEENMEEFKKSEEIATEENTPSNPQNPIPITPVDPCVAGTWNEYGDVPSTHPFYSYICPMARDGIFVGYASTSFSPMAIITRGEMAVHTYRAFQVPNNSSCGSFSDVSTSHPQYVEIMSSKCAGIIGGFSDRTF